MDGEDRRPVLSGRKVHEHGREAALADLLGRQLAYIVRGGDDEDAGVRLREPAQQRAHDTTRDASIGASRRLHATNRFFVLREVEHALRGRGDLERTLDADLRGTEQSSTLAHDCAKVELQE